MFSQAGIIFFTKCTREGLVVLVGVGNRRQLRDVTLLGVEIGHLAQEKVGRGTMTGSRWLAFAGCAPY